MMKEEKILMEKFGKVNHFTVPEGYFDSFADQLMEQLPEPEARVIEMRAESWWHRMQWHKVAAAAVVALLVGSGSMFYFSHSDNHSQMTAKAERVAQPVNSYESNFDQVADYVMVDNQDIYASLVAEN